MKVRVLLIAPAALAITAPPATAIRKATHEKWPAITGALIINRDNSDRPIDMRSGADPFQGTDPTYSCDGVHRYQGCFVKVGACNPGYHTGTCDQAPVMPTHSRRHNELLGGHGDDTIFGGPAGDVIWGDHNYPANPATQVDRLTGGPGNDHIYASHGTNTIHTGGGRDYVYAKVGRGVIHCDAATRLVYLSHRSRKVYRTVGCRHITFRPIGTKEY